MFRLGETINKLARRGKGPEEFLPLKPSQKKFSVREYETLRKNKDKFNPNEKVVVLFKSSTKAVSRTVYTQEIDFHKLKEELENLIK